MSPLDEPHSLFFVLHLCSPFVLVYETGDPRIVVALVLLFELGEQIYYDIFGDYGAIFAWDDGKESLWDVWVLDVGGGFAGIMLGLSFEYIRRGNKSEGNFWTPFLPTPRGKWWVRLLRFLVIGVTAATVAVFGWECVATIPEWCVDGYQIFPLGVPILIVLFVFYIWWVNLPKLSYALLALVFIPTFIPVTKGNEPPPASFIQFILSVTLAIPLFIGCIIHRSKQRSALYKSLA